MEHPLTQFADPDAEVDLRAYESRGGYVGLRRAVTLSPRDVQAVVTASGLRGRGGAGFPTGQKWSFVPMREPDGTATDAANHKFVIVNGDEMEPGTFKDRLLLEGDPHAIVEGAAIAAHAVDASTVILFIRQEYTRAVARVQVAINQARRAGILDADVRGDAVVGIGVAPGARRRLAVHVHVSAGRYMCGEETALLNGLEGRRPTPRAKPPFPQTLGLFGRPTVVNNVETVANLRHIVARGPEWFRGLARSGDGTKLYGLSGRVRQPGLWELPMGMPLRDILDRAGGMKPGFALRGLLPGGASTGFLLPEHLDTPMDFDSVAAAGSRLGTGSIIVLDDRTCPVGFCANLMTFFARESCGWCTPCREGLPWAAKILHALEAGDGTDDDLTVLADLCRMAAPGQTFCALAPGAAEPLASALQCFREDFERHVTQGQCPYRGCG
jgi:NADH-quinone oxidoreductase subunit F